MTTCTMTTKKTSKKKPRGSGERAGISKDAVVAAATTIVDDDGLAALTLSRVASTLRIQTPSLYTHIDGLAHLQQLVKANAQSSLLDATREAVLGRSRGEALRAMCDAQRRWSLAHPGLVPLTVSVTAEDSDELKATAATLLTVVGAVFRGYGLEGDKALHATRILRAATSGFCVLEQQGGFGMALSVDESWRHLVNLLDFGLEQLASNPPDAARPA
jgi:AcrR family transcriptional regulator